MESNISIAINFFYTQHVIKFRLPTLHYVPKIDTILLSAVGLRRIKYHIFCAQLLNLCLSHRHSPTNILL